MVGHEIVELFEKLLETKGIEIPCTDKLEEKDRHTGDNKARLYGMEYWNLVDEIEHLLSNHPCQLSTSMGTAKGQITLNEQGEIIITSKQLDDYLEEYSLE